MTNLLQETFEMLDQVRRRPNEVFWVGTNEWTATFAEFAFFAKDIEYDCGFGLAKIAEDLVVVGEDWWLERGEYDGSEWWRYCTMPERLSAQALSSPKQLLCESYEDKPEHKVEGTQANFDRYIAGDR
jgi:hypothetical protein